MKYIYQKQYVKNHDEVEIPSGSICIKLIDKPKTVDNDATVHWLEPINEEKIKEK